MNLLSRLAEEGGGKILSLSNPSQGPFDHDRLKTRQPREIWPLLLQLAIILFTLDVGIRRVQIDREEWAKATANLRRALFFWKPVERKPEADQALEALLARKERVRSRTAQQTAPPPPPNPDLFRPVAPPKPPDSDSAGAATSGSGDAPTKSESPAPPADSTASRLLDAKRKAKR